MERGQLYSNEISELQNLSSLNISGNQLIGIPNTLINLENLRELYIGDNLFSSIQI